MSFWTTKSSGREKNYVVLKHTLKGVNYVVNGVRFRGGFAVVEKDSKVHLNLKKIPVLRGAQEYPLLLLRKLSFITRPLDVKMIYGADVYAHYIKELDQEISKETQEKRIEKDITHVEVNKKCSSVNKNTGELCKFDALYESPSGYCKKHLLEDPKLMELGIEIPKFMTKKERKKLKDKLIKDLASMKKEGKFNE